MAQLQIEFTCQNLTLEFLVLTDIRGDDFFYLPRFKQQPHAEVVNAGVIAGYGETFGAALDQRADEILGNAAQAEAASSDGHVVS